MATTEENITCPASHQYCGYHLQIATQMAKFGEHQDILICEVKAMHELLTRLAVVEKNVITLDDDVIELKKEHETIKTKLNTIEIKVEAIYKIGYFIGAILTLIATLIPSFF